MARLLLCFRPMSSEEEEPADPSPPSPQYPHGRNPEINNSSESGMSLEPRKTVAFVELLKKRPEPLGLILLGGADCSQPVYVGQLRPGGVAAKSGALQIGDHIRGINGTATEHLNQNEANALLMNSGNVINLEIEFEALPGSDVDNGTRKKTAIIKVRREMNSFGFTISGGRIENRPITVSNVSAGSMAYKNGFLKAGDRVLKINWNDVMRSSLMEALSFLKTSDDICTLEIEYDVTVHEGLEEFSGQLLVELLKPKGATLGLSLQESPLPGDPLIVSKIKEAGIADRCGAFHVGDRLLSLNKESLKNKSNTDVHHMLKHCDLNVEMEIIPAHNFPPPQRLESSPGFNDVASHLSSRPYSSQLTPHDSQSVLSISSVATTNIITTHPESMVIRLEADDIGYGMSLHGGATERVLYPLTIGSIEAGGPAAKLGQLQVGDQILSINGIKMEGYSLQESLKLVQEADNFVELEVMFEVQDAVPPNSGVFEVHMKKKTASLNLGITINGSRSRGDTIWISNLKKGGIAYRSGMLHSGDVIIAINDSSLENSNLREAAQILLNAKESVTLRIGKETNPPASSETIIYSVELQRNQQSLGITLTGSRDQAGHPIVISNIKEDGVAHKTGALKMGDRILAINGESLYNKTVPEAVRMLSSAGDIVNLKISKAMRKPPHKSRHKSGSPTGKFKGHHHRDPDRNSFHSSTSSFIGAEGGVGRNNPPPRTHNNVRSQFSFEPVLGESVSGYNSPDNLSLVSSVSPHLYGYQRRDNRSNRIRDSLMEQRLTPTSEVSGGSGGNGNPAYSHARGGGGHISYSQPWNMPQGAGVGRAMEEEDRISSVSTQNGRSSYFHHQHQHHGSLRSQSGSNIQFGKSGFSKRDSSTDDEMSVNEHEGHVSKLRKTSLQEQSIYHHHHSPSSRREGGGAPHTMTTADGGGGGMWDFKLRGGHRPKQHIPVGRVSPITPLTGSSDRLSSSAVVLSHPQHLKDLEFKVHQDPLPPLPDVLSPPSDDKKASSQPSSPSKGAVEEEKEEKEEHVGVVKIDRDPESSSAAEVISSGVRPGTSQTRPEMEGREEQQVSTLSNDGNGDGGGDDGGGVGGGDSGAHSQSSSSPETERRKTSNQSLSSPVQSPPPSPTAGASTTTASTTTVSTTDAPTANIDPDVISGDESSRNDTIIFKSSQNDDDDEDDDGDSGDGLSKSRDAELEHKNITLTGRNRQTTPTDVTPPNSTCTQLEDKTDLQPLPPPLSDKTDLRPLTPPLSDKTDLRPLPLSDKTDLRPLPPPLSYQSNPPEPTDETDLRPLPPSQSEATQQPDKTDLRPLTLPPPHSTYQSSDAQSINRTGYRPSQDTSKLIDRTELRPLTSSLTPPLIYQSSANSSKNTTAQSSSSSSHKSSNNGDTRHRHRSPPRKSISSPSSGGGGGDRAAKPLVSSLSEFKKTIDHADEFGRAMARLAESGSSDQDSDSEPHSKLTSLPPHEVAKVTAKMKTPQSTILHKVVVLKNPGEVSFGFSISDGQYDQGVYIKTQKPGGPSERGGLLKYDRIVKVNDVILLPEYKCINVYPLLKKHENELVLMVKRQENKKL